MKKLFGLVAVVFSVLALVSPAHAVPCGSSTPMNDNVSWFNCPDFTVDTTGNRHGVEVAGFAYQYNVAATNTGQENIVCESTGGNGSPPGSCLLGGSDTDGQVVIQTDWGNPTVTNCPTGNRIILWVQCADGSGLAASISGALGDYNMDWAHPFDGASFQALDAGTQAGRPQLVSFTGGVLTMHIRKPHVYSDCDATSAGFQFGGCVDNFDGNSLTVGNIYTTILPCNQSPTTDKSKWTPAAPSSRTNNADGSTDASITMPTATTGNCAYVGTTMLSGPAGSPEGGAITGFVSVAPQGAASPEALGIAAKASSGRVSVSFYTQNEFGLAGFNIYTQTNKGLVKLNSALIAAKGGPSTYVENYSRGLIGGGKSIIVETLMTDGTSHKSAPVSF